MISTGKQGIFEYQLEGENKIVAFITNPTTGWIIGGTVYLEDFKNKQGRY